MTCLDETACRREKRSPVRLGNMLPPLASSRWLYLRHVDRQMKDSILRRQHPQLHGIDVAVPSNSQG
jgi:hypothetical protein